MRATRLACLVLLWLLVNTTLLLAGDTARKPGPPWHSRGGKPPREQKVNVRYFSWDADGFGEKEEDAKQDAIQKGHIALLAYLVEQGFSLEWQPSPRFTAGLLKDWTPLNLKDREGEDQEVVDVKIPGLENPRRWKAHFELTSKDYVELLGQERQYRSEQRLGILGKGLAGLVALLAAVAGYFRLEEATKGYYTAWLRVGTVGFLTAVGAGIWFLS
jgi:hypothetical protein